MNAIVILERIFFVLLVLVFGGWLYAIHTVAIEARDAAKAALKALESSP